jgi:DNA-directed RNA polymerase specialized sigma24 family protein
MPELVAEAFPDRLQKAAQEVQERRDALILALEHRDELVVQAVDDEGMSHSAVADLIGVRKGRISAILAGSQPDAGAGQ